MFSILCIVRRDNKDESFLLLHTLGKVICYNLMENTFKKISDLVPSSDSDENAHKIRFGWFNAYPTLIVSPLFDNIHCFLELLKTFRLT